MKNAKLFYATSEDKDGSVDKFLEKVAAAGFTVVERRPFKEDEPSEGVVAGKTYFNDRVILEG